MIAAWMLYATLVAMLVGAAAWTLERGLQAHRVALRWIWTAALLGSCTIPMVAMLRSAPSAQYVPIAAQQQPTYTPPPEIPLAPAPEPSRLSRVIDGTLYRLSAPPTLPARLDPLASGIWGLLTLGVVGALGGSFAKLRRSRRKWVSEEIDGRDVLISDEVGPAVVGVINPAIVVPRWALSLPREDRELVLRHEEEHRRAGDLRLLFASLVLLVLVPWNAALWWQVRRLRMAVELDCDHRVLRKARELRRYATLLVEMGRRGTISRLSALALAHPAPFLERRIQKMTSRTKPRWSVTASLALAASFLTIAGSRVQAPPAPQPEGQVDMFSAPTALPEGPQVAGKRLVQPDLPVIEGAAALTSRQSASAATAQEIPRLEGIAVTGTAGAARRRAAEAAGAQPAPTATIRPPEPTPQPTVQAVRQPGARLRDAPVALPHTVRPELSNGDEVSRALVRAYPTMLRDASLSGTVGVWLFIDENGIVDNVLLQASSDYTELNEAALGVARTMRFNAASNGGERVALWVSVPITFRVAGAARGENVSAEASSVGGETAGSESRTPDQPVGRVTGRVTDRTTQAPLQYVQVYIVGASLGTLSRQNGVFVILNVPPGTYELRAERVGLTLGRRVITITEGEAVEANFELDEQAIGMDEVLNDRTPGTLIPGATYSTQRPASPLAAAGQAAAAQVLEDTPRFTPHSVKPHLLNGPEVQAVMVREYPSGLREAGIRGTAVVWLFIDVEGVVANAKVQTTSGYPALDAAALTTARAMRFTPAYNRDQKVPVWVSIPITLRPS